RRPATYLIYYSLSCHRKISLPQTKTLLRRKIKRKSTMVSGRIGCKQPCATCACPTTPGLKVELETKHPLLFVLNCASTLEETTSAPGQCITPPFENSISWIARDVFL